jgi:FixJ family two-component response regulator
VKTNVKPAGKPVGPTVYIVDDDISVRESLRGLVVSVGLHAEAFSSAKEFLRHPRPDVPSCLVLDVRLPGQSGLDLQREMVAGNHTIPIVIITAHGDIAMGVGAMKAGAVDFLVKPFREQDLLDAMQRAIERDAKALQQRTEAAGLRSRYELLTPREREVMHLVVRGLLNKQIAGELGTSEVTVKIQRGQVMQKMQTESVPELVRFSQKLGLPDPST